MKKTWDITIDGTNHTIQYKAGFGCKILVDGQQYKVKSSNWFIQLIDYAIDFGSTQCRLVAIGNKVDLAVNGTYLGSGKPYEPVSNTPAWIYVLVGLSILGGYFWGGLLCMLVGVLFSVLYIQSALNRKTGMVIGCFIGCTVIQLALGLLFAGLLVAAGIG